jgi:transposase-like protein
LEHYIYQLEENLSPISDEVKAQIIKMYRDGKTLMVIENTLNIPKTKIEMILKEYKMKENKYDDLKALELH